MKHFLMAFLGLFLVAPKSAQCDLILSDVNIEAGTFTIEFLNTDNCGGSGGPDGVSEIQIGFQALDPNNDCSAMNQGWTFPSGITIPDDSNHPGWVYSATSAELPPSNWTNGWDDWPWDIDPPYYAGETITFPLYNQYEHEDCDNGPWANNLTCQLEDALNFWLDEGLSIQAVIWQISYGPTMYADEGGWAEVGSLGDGTTPGCCGIYEDNNFEDNWVIIGPCEQQSNGPDAVIGNVEFEIGCIGDVPTYSVSYVVYNYGNEDITEYCIEIWNEDYYQCFNGDLFGSYEIPPGEGQAFTTPFFEYDALGGSFFVMSVDNVNDEIITGNNNTTVFYPDELENLECPEECESDTVEIFVTDTLYIDNYIYITDTITEIITEYVTEYVTDTVYEEIPIYLTDTLYITETEFIVDTLYITEYVTDTIYLTETEYLTDTLYITEFVTDTLFIDNYIYLTDTITEYIVQEMWIDCETGLPCDEDPPGLDCPDWTTIHAPNTFTPNNDGINDVWKLIYDLNCWEDVEFWIYNRWGNEIYHAEGDSYDSYPYWDGSVQGGNHYVADGVYVYTFKGKRIGRTDTIQESGHISVFR